MLDSIENYSGVWDIRIDGEKKTRFECPYIDYKHCNHPDNLEGLDVFGYENCVYQDCPIRVRESFEKL